jgi:hypothetical protein
VALSQTPAMKLCLYLSSIGSRDSVYGDGGFFLRLRLVDWELRKRLWLKYRRSTCACSLLDCVANTEGLESGDTLCFCRIKGDQRNSHGVISIM